MTLDRVVAPAGMTLDRVVAIVPAGGSGSRMRASGAPSKQFRELCGLPLLVRTLQVFERSSHVSEVIVVAPSEDVPRLTAYLRHLGLSKIVATVAGGNTRQASVAKGLSAAGQEPAIALIHDAVRPFLPAENLADVIGAAREFSAAALAIPVTDTLRRADDGKFSETVSRDGLWQMQTPQAFSLRLLRRAHGEAKGDYATDDVELVGRLGVSSRVVKGSSVNFKITTEADWLLATAFWPVWAGREKLASP
jgi:2-C-methyl-D-erythritol 4-phosphate cytidylyltransferase